MTEATAPAAAESRYMGLDTLRGLAVLRIVFFHYTTVFDRTYGHQGETFELSHTQFSVPMFFVISGFVIPLTLRKCRTVADFAFLRVSRLYPTFLVCLATTFLVVHATRLTYQASTGDALLNLTMIGHALGGEFVDPAYWTLEVEVFFYAIMAALLFFDWVHAAGALFLGLAMVHAVAGHIGWAGASQSLLLENAHLFAIGILLFQVKFERRRWHFGAIAAVWLVALFDRGAEYLLWIGAFFALTSLSVFVNPRFLRIKPLVWFGGLSYPLYLLHARIGVVVMRTVRGMGSTPYVALFCAFCVALGLAYTVHRFVELPAMNWARERRRRAREAQAHTPAPVASKAAAE